ncbi:MAG: hypothetical protein IKQ99_03160 [Alphaproteobacteria bacterium]|nr:hypothetical protein [Alphaproteobacteria bacterium]
MATESKSVSGNILFRLFWWIVLRLNPQWAHKLMYFGLRDGSFGRTIVKDPALSVTVWGHTFNTPIGIGGGVDKKGNIIDRLMQIGYGFGTFGPYTLEKELPVKQTYYFRKEKSILVQCLGFRNPGLLKMLPLFVKRRYLPHFVGVDLVIPAESEDQNIKQGRHFTYQEEFVLMAQKVAPYCDFITLDLSHPNSELSMLVVDASTVVPIIKEVHEAVRVAAPIQTPPILVKIPLDLNAKEIPLVARNLVDSGVDGVVISGPLSLSKNSLIQLPGLKDERIGMLSGALIKEQTLDLIRQIYEQTKGQVTIVGCGGVFSAEDAFEQIKAGASLIQIDNPALTFGGPTCVSDIHKGLLKLLEENHFSNVMEAIGSGVQKDGWPTSPVSQNKETYQPENVSEPVQPVPEQPVPEQPISNEEVTAPVQPDVQTVQPPVQPQPVPPEITPAPVQPVQEQPSEGQNPQDTVLTPPVPPVQQ